MHNKQAIKSLVYKTGIIVIILLVFAFFSFLSQWSNPSARAAHIAGTGPSAGGITINSVSPDPADNSIVVSGTGTGGNNTLHPISCSGPDIPGSSDSTVQVKRLLTPTEYRIDSGSFSNFTLTQSQAGANHVACTLDGNPTDYLYSFSFNVNTASLSNGTHTVTVRVRDEATGIDISHSRSFTVNHGLPALGVSCSNSTGQSVPQDSDIFWDCTLSNAQAGYTYQVDGFGPTPPGANALPNQPGVIFPPDFQKGYHIGPTTPAGNYAVTLTVAGYPTDSSQPLHGPASTNLSFSVTASTPSPTASITSTSSGCYGSPAKNSKNIISFSLSNATSWSVWRSGTQVSGSNPASPFEDTSPTAGQTYSYEVRATGPGGSVTSIPASQQTNYCTVAITINVYQNGSLSPTSYTLSGPEIFNGSTSSATYQGLNNNSSGGYSWSLPSITIPSGTVLSSVTTANGTNLPSPYEQTTSPGNSTTQATATFNINLVTARTLTVTPTGTGSGSVTVNPGNNVCSTTAGCTYTFANNTPVSMQANPNPGSSFNRWTGAGNPCSPVTANPCNFNITGNRNLNALFNINQYSVSVTKNIAAAGSVSSSPAGIDCGGTCSANFNAGSNITLIANNFIGYTFSSWSGDCSSTSGNQCTISNIQAAKNIMANFNINQYALTVTRNGTGSGTVTSSPAGINCGADCSENYNYNTSVTLSAAVVSDGSSFAGWSGGGCTGTGGCIVSMTAAQTVTATFNTVFRTLNVTSSNGTVTSGPAGINCGADCSENYPDGTSVTLSVSPNAGYNFTGWGGACTGTGSCTLTMNGNKSVTANYAINSYTLSVTSSNGTVTSSPAGIICGGDCSESYTSGTSVTLSVSVNSGYVFTGWSGDCSGTGTCSVTMNANKNVTANYGALPGSFTLSSIGSGSSLSCSGSTPQVNLSWSASSGVSSYTVVRGGVDQANVGLATSYTQSVTAGQTYTYKVRANNSNGSRDSNEISFTANYCTGTITVNATLNGAPYNGLTYTLSSNIPSVNGTTPQTHTVQAEASRQWSIGNFGNEPAGAILPPSITPGTFGTLNGNTNPQPNLAFTVNYTVGPDVTMIAPSSAQKNTNFTISWSSNSVVTVVTNSSFDCAVAAAGSTETTGSRNVNCSTTGNKTFTITVRNAAGATDTETRVVNITAAPTRNLTVTKAGSGRGSVTSSPAGLNCDANCSSAVTAFTLNDTVTLTATAQSGSSVFGSWSGCNSTSGTQCTVNMNSDKAVTATFNPLPGAFTVSLNTPASACIGTAPQTRLVWTSSANATAYLVFRNGSFLGNTTITSFDDNFSLVSGTSYEYRVRATNSFGGTDASNLVTKVAVYCTGTITVTTKLNGTSYNGVTYNLSSSIGSVNGTSNAPAHTVTADQSRIWTLGNFGSEPANTTRSIIPGSSATLNGNTNPQPSISFTVNYTSLGSHNLSVTRDGTGSGSVTSSPAGINCGATCSAPFTDGTVVTLTAAQAVGSTFAGWSGAGCSGTGTCSVTMNATKAVTATFNTSAGPTRTLTLNKSGSGAGTVVSDVGGINCNPACSTNSTTFSNGTTVILTATADSSSTFGNWAGCDSTSGTNCTLTMNADRTVTAAFNSAGGPGVFSLSPTATGATSCSGASPRSHLQWSASSGATSYAVYRSLDNVNFTSYAPSATSPWTDSTVTSGTIYYYRIRALSGTGSTDSNVVSIQASYCTGTITVNATLNGNPYTGLTYTLSSTLPSVNGTSPGSHTVTADQSRIWTVGNFGNEPAGNPTPTVSPGSSATLNGNTNPQPNLAFTVNYTTGGACGTPQNTFEACVYTGTNFTTYNSTFTESAINHSWGGGGPAGLSDNFSVRWKGRFNTFSPGTYQFTTVSDDGVRLYVNGTLVINNWTDHAPTTNVGNAVMSNGNNDIVLEYYENAGGATISLSWTPIAGGSCPGNNPTNTFEACVYTGANYQNFDPAGYNSTFTESAINHSYGSGGPGSLQDQYAIRWQGRFNTFSGGTYRFTTQSDDGVRLYVNGVLVIDNWTDHGTTTNNADVVVNSANNDIVLAFYENGGNSVITMSWSQISAPPAAPSSLSADNTTQCGQIRLAWTDNSTNELGFHVWRAPYGGSGPQLTYNGTVYGVVASYTANVIAHTDTPPAGSSYSYVVTSFNNDGESSVSAANAVGPVFNNSCAPNLSLSGKDIYQVFQNGTWSNYIGQTIYNNDLIKFRIVISNNGNSTAYDVYVQDTPSSNLIYQTGSARLQKGTGPNLPISEQVSGSSIYFDASRNLGDKAADGTNWILTFDARAQSTAAQPVDYFSNSARIFYSLTDGGPQSSSVTASTGQQQLRTSPPKVPDIKEIN